MIVSKFFKCLAVFGVAGLISFSAAAAENKEAEPAAVAATEEEQWDYERNLYNMGRGFVNIGTCWLEIPRCFIYHNSQVPVMGAVVGVVEGTGLTLVRAFSGVADIVSLGFMSDSIFESTFKFKEWVWESRWVPEE